MLCSRMMLACLLILLLVQFDPAVSAIPAAGDKRTAVEMLERELRSRDLTFPNGSFRHLLEFGPGEPGPAGPISVKAELPVRELDKGEKMLAGGWSPPSGGRNSLVKTLKLVRDFYVQHGVLPRDGVELISWSIASTRSPAEVSVIAGLGPESLFEQVKPVLNPATGRMYETLNNDAWHPYGVWIGPESNAEVFQSTIGVSPEEYRHHHPAEGLPELWRIKVFGKTENSIVVDKLIIHKRSTLPNAAESVDASATPCSDCP